jgi:hypothetical protein
MQARMTSDLITPTQADPGPRQRQTSNSAGYSYTCKTCTELSSSETYKAEWQTGASRRQRRMYIGRDGEYRCPGRRTWTSVPASWLR